MFENGNVFKGIDFFACMSHSLQSQMRAVFTCYEKWIFG